MTAHHRQHLDWHTRWCRLGDQVSNLGQLAAVLTLALTVTGLITLTALSLT